MNTSYVPTVWRIVFNTSEVIRRGRYTLRIALASSNMAEIQVRINKFKGTRPHFSTGLIGKDNAIARHGIHGLYRLYNVTVLGSQLVEGTNTIYLRQSRPSSPFIGVMYDYIRLEAPACASTNTTCVSNASWISNSLLFNLLLIYIFHFLASTFHPLIN